MTKEEKKIHREYFQAHRAEFDLYIQSDKGRKAADRHLAFMFTYLGILISFMFIISLIQW